MHVDPLKPKLKPPGTELLKLKYDEPPSNFAFKLYLRRYIMAYFDVASTHLPRARPYPSRPERHRESCGGSHSQARRQGVAAQVEIETKI